MNDMLGIVELTDPQQLMDLHGMNSYRLFHQAALDRLKGWVRPRDEWRIGTEHEKFGYCKDTLKPLPYDGPRSIRAMLEGLRDRYGWDPVLEGGNIIGLVKDGANVSLEPGCQLELSGAPLETIHQTCDEVNEHLAEVKAVADRIGAGVVVDKLNHFAETHGDRYRPAKILEEHATSGKTFRS